MKALESNPSSNAARRSLVEPQCNLVFESFGKSCRLLERCKLMMSKALVLHILVLLTYQNAIYIKRVITRISELDWTCDCLRLFVIETKDEITFLEKLVGHLLKKKHPTRINRWKKTTNFHWFPGEFPATPRHDVFQNSNWRHIKPTSQISQETGGESLGFEGFPELWWEPIFTECFTIGIFEIWLYKLSLILDI